MPRGGHLVVVMAMINVCLLTSNWHCIALTPNCFLYSMKSCLRETGQSQNLRGSRHASCFILMFSSQYSVQRVVDL